MQPADNEFFEEYKHLDKLCGDMYSCRNGISEYIDQMDNKSHRGYHLVPLWDSDYKMLKHIRWVRNQIAHDSGAYQVSESEDLEFVRNFYDRIFSGQDPLTLLRKEEEKAAARRKNQNKQQTTPVQPPDEVSIYAPQPLYISQQYTSIKKKSRGRIGLIIGAGATVLIFIILIIILFSVID